MPVGADARDMNVYQMTELIKYSKSLIASPYLFLALT